MPKNAASAVMRVIRSTAESSGSGPSDRELLRRFAAGDDQAAFAALVRRHGPLVLGVCRRVLPNLQDAEDACQATFLVLAKKAESNRWQPSIANWLYATARKVAANARIAARRRARRESRAAVPEAVQPVDQMTGRELLATLDEELDKLPSRYREPLLLCYLEGLTRDEAAHRLHTPAATLKTRLERGRKRLGAALTRRGCVLGAGLLALATTSPAGASASSLVRAVLSATSGSPPVAVAALAKGVGVNGLMSKSLLLVLALVGTAALGSAVGLAARPVAGQQSDNAMAAKAPAQALAPVANRPPADDKDSLAYSGRVLGPDGKPVAGAKLFICDSAGKRPAPQPAADADGRFRFTLGPPPDGNPKRYVLAMAEGFGLDWAGVGLEPVPGELALRLPVDVPIRGRVVDLEGRPVAGAALALQVLQTTPSDNLDEFLKAWDEDKEDGSRAMRLLQKKSLAVTEAPKPLSMLRTSADGTFTVGGIGRDRVAEFRVAGEGVAVQLLRVITRSELRPSSRPVAPDHYHVSGPELTVVVAPSKPFMGVVPDARTRQPIAGVTVAGELLGQVADRVYGSWRPVEAVSDAEGRYRLDGLAKTPKRLLAFVPPPGTPHLRRFVEVADSEGFQPLTVDVDLFRGVVVSGRVTDKATGRPAPGSVRYDPLVTNGQYGQTPGYAHPRGTLSTWLIET